MLSLASLSETMFLYWEGGYWMFWGFLRVLDIFLGGVIREEKLFMGEFVLNPYPFRLSQGLV